MKVKWQANKTVFIVKMALAVVMTLVILVSPLPQTVQAATCRTYHWVSEGETTPYIAHTYKLKWREIAEANNLDIGEKPEVGQRLCIPPEEEESTKKQKIQPEDEEKANISVSVSAGRIHINVSKFSSRHVYLVKVRDVDVGVGGWEKLKYVKIAKNKSYSFSYSVPKKLQGTRVLNVCLKDQTSDELICRSALNQ